MKREEMERSAKAAKNANSVIGEDLLAAELPIAANGDDTYADVQEELVPDDIIDDSGSDHNSYGQEE